MKVKCKLKYWVFSKVFFFKFFLLLPNPGQWKERMRNVIFECSLFVYIKKSRRWFKHKRDNSLALELFVFNCAVWFFFKISGDNFYEVGLEQNVSKNSRKFSAHFETKYTDWKNTFGPEKGNCAHHSSGINWWRRTPDGS